MVRRLLFLNGFAVVCAVINHAIVWDLTAMFWWADRFLPPGTVDYAPLKSWRFFSTTLIDQLVFFAVFVFLFISGYFIAVAAGRQQRSIPWVLVLQRIKFLIVPYLLWTVVILALNILQGQTYTAWDLVKVFLLGGVSPPYYYVIVLVQLYILSPLLVPLARERWKALLLVTGLLQLLALGAYYAALFDYDLGALEPAAKILRDWQMLSYAFWFFLGTVIGFNLQSFSARLIRWRWFLFIGLLASFALGFSEYTLVRLLANREWISPQVTFFNRSFVFFILMTFLAFENMPMLFFSSLSKLGARSYGIYLIQVIPMELTAKLVYHVAPQLMAYQFLWLTLLVVMGIGVPVIMMEIINRSAFRRYYKYLFG